MLPRLKHFLLGFFILLLALAGISGGAQAQITARAPDGFYEPPPQASREPGALLRSEPLTGVTLPAGSRGWRILYATSVDDRTPAVAVAIVFAPINSPAGPRPVIMWEHATTGVMQKCMPSLLSSPAEGIPARERFAAEGWVVIATDYPFAEKDGPHPFLIGEGEARSGLDSVRAARHMPELQLGERTVVWGHSQGGHAALWTGAIAQRYAPDVQIAGVVAIAPAADMELILRMNPEVDRRIGPSVAAAYSRFYPDVRFDQVLRAGARPVAREMASLCGFIPPEDPMRVGALVSTFTGPSLVTTNRAFTARIRQNAATQAVTAPLLIAQGEGDFVIPQLATSVFVQERCLAGQRMEYWTFDADHGTIVAPGSAFEDPLIAWTRARFAGEPQASGCTRRIF